MYHALIVRPVIVILRSILTAACLVGGAMAAEPVPADPVPFDISGQPLRDALVEFARQSDRELLFSTDVVEDKEANYVAGTYEPEDALELLLADTGLEYSVTANDTILVAEEGGDSDSGNGRTAGATPRPVMMAQALAEQSQTSQRIETNNDKDETKRPLEEIIVTGTNIRGIAPDSSPTRTFTREDIQISGASTVQDFFQTLTANFGGGSNLDLPFGQPNDTNTQTNLSFGSSVNLRGLGSGSTLVLLNGHRLAPTSSIGDFVDISMIPASAIERVDLLTDGASSIYGGDAIAGVANFILRDDFEGLEASFRYGIGTQHRSPEEYRAGMTGGLNWTGGHALFSYEYFNRDQIGAQDRAFSQGVPLPNYLQPSLKRHGVLGSISQELTSNLGAFANLTFSKKDTRFDTFETIFGGTITSRTPASKNLNSSAGGYWKVSDTWFVDFSGTFSKYHDASQREMPSPVKVEVDSKVWASDIKTSGTVLSLPGGDLKLAIGGHYRRENYRFFDVLAGAAQREADRQVYAVYGEAFIPIVGPDIAISGIERLEINVSGRFEDYSDFGSTANPKVGVLWSPFEGLKLRGSYSTSFNPPPLGRVGEKRNQAVAFFTSFVNSALGFTPADPSIADVVFIHRNGVSKNLDAEHSRAFTAGFDFTQQWDRHEIAFSSTWFDLELENRLGTTPCPACVNGISFDAPNVAFNDPGAFPEGTVIFMPTLDQINDALNSADEVLANSPPAFGNPFDAEIISVVDVIRNLARTKVSGLDFDMTYSYELGAGDLVLGVDGTYLFEYKQQAAVKSPIVEQLNTLYNPVDLKLRGRIGYANDGLSANAFLNYVNEYKVDNTINAAPVDSWATVDLSLSYDTQNKMENSILNDTVFRLSVINLFDQDPPSAPGIPNLAIHGYDPTNASPLGRFVAFEVTKRF